MIVGNDVSEFQGQIDFGTFKSNANFVILRASYGNGYVDKEFSRNQSEVKRVGLPHGYYHYAYPQYNTPESEADWFLQTIGNIEEGELLVLDFEEQYGGNVIEWCKSFLDRVSEKLDGYKPLMYLNQNQLKSYDWSPLSNADYGLWVAAYTYDPTNNNFETGSWNNAAMQQWTDKQDVPGIPGSVDGDCFFGDLEAFGKYGYHAPQQVTEQPVEPPQEQAQPAQPATPAEQPQQPEEQTPEETQTPETPATPATPEIQEQPTQTKTTPAEEQPAQAEVVNPEPQVDNTVVNQPEETPADTTTPIAPVGHDCQYKNVVDALRTFFHLHLNATLIEDLGKLKDLLSEL